jgi:hypothetical protein
MSKIDPTTEAYFDTLDKKGGPTDPLSGIDEVIKSFYIETKKYQNPKAFPMYQYFEKYSINSQKGEHIFP